MNQILDYNNSSNNYNNYNSNNNNFNKDDGSDKIVRVFAVLIMIFAIVLISVVGYGMFSNNSKDNNDESVNNKENEGHAKISVNIEGEEAIIEVTNDVNIKQLIYGWNSSSERTIDCDSKYVKETIDVVAGDNSLFIKVIDENGLETTANQNISSEKGIDMLDPVIELSVTEEKKLKIVAKDETALDFITIRWNEDDEQTIYADEGSKEIVEEIEILKGDNDLTVIAVDASNNTTRENKIFKGRTKPEIKVELVEDGSKINIKAMHENGIKLVKLNFNNNDYNVDIGDDNPTQIEFEQPLETGYNRIIITVKSVDDTETVFDGECTYGDVSTNTRREVSDDEENDSDDQETDVVDEENDSDNQETDDAEDDNDDSEEEN